MMNNLRGTYGLPEAEVRHSRVPKGQVERRASDISKRQSHRQDYHTQGLCMRVLYRHRCEVVQAIDREDMPDEEKRGERHASVDVRWEPQITSSVERFFSVHHCRAWFSTQTWTTTALPADALEDMDMSNGVMSGSEKKQCRPLRSLFPRTCSSLAQPRQNHAHEHGYPCLSLPPTMPSSSPDIEDARGLTKPVRRPMSMLTRLGQALCFPFIFLTLLYLLPVPLHPSRYLKLQLHEPQNIISASTTTLLEPEPPLLDLEDGQWVPRASQLDLTSLYRGRYSSVDALPEGWPCGDPCEGEILEKAKQERAKQIAGWTWEGPGAITEELDGTKIVKELMRSTGGLVLVGGKAIFIVRASTILIEYT